MFSMRGDVLTGLGKESDQVVQMIFSCNLHFQKKTFTCSLSDGDRLVISDSEAINKDTDRHAKTEKDTNTETSYFSTVAVQIQNL